MSDEPDIFDHILFGLITFVAGIILVFDLLGLEQVFEDFFKTEATLDKLTNKNCYYP